ncbi:hypothetical protein ACFV4E_22385 [Streptomyces hygroscopicus]|uniref:Phage head morphogenesis domain-containing protein n=1 Tax=Streptomyces hygroscopicus TaxID=1912 RepID=A0ABQ3UFF9_STRHY|nr:hypothetical protein [Streptomyces hygroscopicus]GHJ34344.1 hypothetical protein TPA0910_87770 [Streptomyces hygroscopicus]
MTTPVRRRSLRARILAYITDATSRLQAAWRILTAAQTALLNALAAIRSGRRTGNAAAIRRITAAFQRSLTAFDRAAAAFVERWATSDLPLIYREGAWTMLDQADRPPDRFSWTQRHQDAITTASAQYYADLTRRIQEALRRARAFLRAAQATARSAELDVEALRRDHPLDTVIYGTSTRYPADAWAHAAISWQAVTTANTGAARTALDELGCEWLEVRDGSECGWLKHNDPDEANRTLRTVQDALAHPSAHPHCQREFLPRLDLTGRTEIRSGALL